MSDQEGARLSKLLYWQEIAKSKSLAVDLRKIKGGAAQSQCLVSSSDDRKSHTIRHHTHIYRLLATSIGNTKPNQLMLRIEACYMYAASSASSSEGAIAVKQPAPMDKTRESAGLDSQQRRTEERANIPTSSQLFSCISTRRRLGRQVCALQNHALAFNRARIHCAARWQWSLAPLVVVAHAELGAL